MDRFEVWFGAIFLGIGLLALFVSGTLSLALVRTPRARPNRWAILAAPLAIGIIFSAVGAGFAGYGLWQEQLEQRLLATGTPARATVVAVEQSYTRINGRYQWRVRYQYQDQAGGTHQGTSGLMDPALAQTWRPGEQAFVRYDPADPATSIWLGREDRAGLAPGHPRHSPAWSLVRTEASRALERDVWPWTPLSTSI
jgi:hypothetical protein